MNLQPGDILIPKDPNFTGAQYAGNAISGMIIITSIEITEYIDDINFYQINNQTYDWHCRAFFKAYYKVLK